jgi:hypothetical protein
MLINHITKKERNEKKFEGLGIILIIISFILCFIKTIAYFYELSKTLGFVEAFILFLLPFHSFPTYSVFKPIDFLVNIVLVFIPPFIAFNIPLLAPWTLGDWTSVIFCIIGAL